MECLVFKSVFSLVKTMLLLLTVGLLLHIADCRSTVSPAPSEKIVSNIKTGRECKTASAIRELVAIRNLKFCNCVAMTCSSVVEGRCARKSHYEACHVLASIAFYALTHTTARVVHPDGVSLQEAPLGDEEAVRTLLDQTLLKPDFKTHVFYIYVTNGVEDSACGGAHHAVLAPDSEDSVCLYQAYSATSMRYSMKYWVFNSDQPLVKDYTSLQRDPFGFTPSPASLAARQRLIDIGESRHEFGKGIALRSKGLADIIMQLSSATDGKVFGRLFGCVPTKFDTGGVLGIAHAPLSKAEDGSYPGLEQLRNAGQNECPHIPVK